MIRAAVIGWPIEHSRSPLIHGHWLAKYGIDGAYTKIAVKPEEVGAFLAKLAERGLAGCNVTLPHKEAAFRAAVEKDASAVAVGAANTLWLEGGRLYAANTDTYGFMRHLDLSAPQWRQRDRPVLVLGAGGAARGIVYGLLEAGVGRVRVANRTLARAEEIAGHFGSKVEALDWGKVADTSGDSGLLINATSLGMAKTGPLDFDVGGLPVDAVVADIVYVPLETKLLAAARARGLATVDGLGMLLHQAVPGFGRWFGVTPEVTAELRQMIVGDIEGGLMLLIGLTGSIGMGKSTVAKRFIANGLGVCDADAEVHKLYAAGGAAVAPIEAAFPGVTGAGGVERPKLAAALLADPTGFKRLEAIVHPLVFEAERDFLRIERERGAAMAVLEIPLLLENKSGPRVDVVVVVSAPADVQRRRVLERPGMTPEKLDQILARQLPDAEKRARADYVVDTGVSIPETEAEVDKIVAELRGRDGTAFERFWA